MRAILIGGLLSSLAACGRTPRSSGEPAVDLPPRTTAVATKPAGPDSITVTLTADGRILSRGRAWSLAGLEEMLRTSVRHEGPQWHASTVVRLRIDRAAPWIHVRWLVHAAMVSYVYELRFVYDDAAAGEADVRSTVSSLIGESSSFSDVVRIRVVVDASGRIQCGERVAADPSAVSAWAAEATSSAHTKGLARVWSDIAPRDGTPWGTVAAVYERLRSSGATPLHFAGGELRPDDHVRKLERLPPPDAAASARASDESSDSGGMRIESVGNPGAEFDPCCSEWDPPLEEIEVPLDEPEPEVPEDADKGR